jgi:hypothetical protein
MSGHRHPPAPSCGQLIIGGALLFLLFDYLSRDFSGLDPHEQFSPIHVISSVGVFLAIVMGWYDWGESSLGIFVHHHALRWLAACALKRWFSP